MKKYLLSMLAGSVLFGFEFQPLGFTAVGMGGAGVASAKGSMALYYNPALLAKHRYGIEFSLGAGIGMRENNLIDRIDRLANDDELSDTIDKIGKHAPVSGSNTADGTNKKMEDALNQLKALSKGNGFSIQPTAEFSAQIQQFGIGIFAVGDITAQAIIDKQHLSIIVQDDNTKGYYSYEPKTDTYSISNKSDYDKYSLEYALDNKLTYININGIVVSEVPLGYAHSFDLKNSTLSVGAALKYMEGITYKNNIAVDSDNDDLDDSLDKNQETSSQLGIDLGALWSFDKLDVGLVGKDLNSPEFKFYDGSKYKIKPMVRGGLNFEFNDWVQFAMDIDLTRNDTAIQNYKSQYIGGGLNFHQSWFSVRAGMRKNIAESSEGNIITAGLGLGLKWFSLDVAAEASTKKGSYDGNEIPRYAKVNIALLSRWGGK